MLRRTRRFPNPFHDYSGSMPTGTSTETVLNSVREIVGRILANTSDRVNECDGGMYVGTPGVAYALYRAARSGLFPTSEATAFFERARILADVAVHWADSERDPKTRAGFLLGGAGAYLVAALLNNLCGKMDEVRKYVDRYASLSRVCEPMSFLSCGSDEFFVGRAGYLMGALILQRDTGIEVLPPNQAALLCRTMVESGRQYSARVQSLSPLMFSYYDVEYLGAAHGLAAILQVLLLHEKLLSEAECSLVWASVDFLLMLERDGNWPPVMCEQIGSDDDQLVHWCHGAPGVALLFVKAYQLSGRPQYLAACERAAQCVWNKGLLRKGPGTCHGVAGNGYLFLVLYRLTQDPKYFYRAYRFMEFMFTEEFCRGARTPDSPYSLFEGLAGTACFLLDLIKPDGAEFPLYATL